MLDKLGLEKLGKRLVDDLGSVLPQNELELLLESALSRLNLVTREQFDAQAAVLLRTREKVETLEKELEQLQKIVAARTNAGEPGHVQEAVDSDEGAHH